MKPEIKTIGSTKSRTIWKWAPAFNDDDGICDLSPLFRALSATQLALQARPLSPSGPLESVCSLLAGTVSCPGKIAASDDHAEDEKFEEEPSPAAGALLDLGPIVLALILSFAATWR